MYDYVKQVKEQAKKQGATGPIHVYCARGGIITSIFILYILYFIFYILYFIFYILYFIFYILYFIFYILYFIFYICILYFVFCILYLVSCILYLVSCILYLVSFYFVYFFKIKIHRYEEPFDELAIEHGVCELSDAARRVQGVQAVGPLHPLSPTIHHRCRGHDGRRYNRFCSLNSSVLPSLLLPSPLLPLPLTLSLSSLYILLIYACRKDKDLARACQTRPAGGRSGGYCES